MYARIYANLCPHSVNNVSGEMPDEHLNKTAAIIF